MKAIFTHSHRFRQIDENMYSSGGLPNNVLARYVSAFGELTVVARIEVETTADTRYSKIDLPIRFVDYRTLSKNLLREMVSSADCIIARVPSGIGYRAICEAKRQHKPYLVEVVGCAWDALWNHSWQGKLLALPSFLRMRRAVRNAPYAIYVTKEFLQKRYPCNGKTEYCSDVAISMTDKAVPDNRAAKIRALGDKVILGTAAALNVRYKGQQYVIKALAKLKQQGHSNYEYQLIGGGDYSYLLSVAKKYGVTDQVKFIGSLPHDEVFTWLDKIDIYIQPSQTEGLPRALIEAMSRGLPCIGTDVGGIPELLPKTCICKASRRLYEEICEQLMKYDVSEAISEAKRNYSTAMAYQESILNARRQQFFQSFACSIDENEQ